MLSSKNHLLFSCKIDDGVVQPLIETTGNMGGSFLCYNPVKSRAFLVAYTPFLQLFLMTSQYI